jgi:hypothetical protein
MKEESSPAIDTPKYFGVDTDYGKLSTVGKLLAGCDPGNMAVAQRRPEVGQLAVGGHVRLSLRNKKRQECQLQS